MRSEPSILHLDLDAFFAAVEQRDKPSLRGKPVIVGGLGPRGVVSTASYEARQYGVRSAMRMAEARARCPHAAFLGGRFAAYRATSRAVQRVLRDVSPLVEPLSLDEAFVDLAMADVDLSGTGVRAVANALKDAVHAVSGGLTASIGVGSSKLVAKVASDLDKPDGLVVVEPGTELDLLRPMPVGTLPGVGPATRERLRRIGVLTIGQLADTPEDDVVALLGSAHGHSLARLARADDDRPVVVDTKSKSVSVEDTFDTDIADPAMLGTIVDRLARRVGERLENGRLSGRTVTVKIRLFDFTTHSRSATLAGPTDDVRTIMRMARRLLTEVDTSAGVRLLGVGVSGLANWVQDDLFSGPAHHDPSPAGQSATPTAAGADDAAVAGREPGEPVIPDGDGATPADAGADAPTLATPDTDAAETTHQGSRQWVPGADVVHDQWGHGWVWGAGMGRVTVRFETALTGPGPVRTLAADDPGLVPWQPDPDPEERGPEERGPEERGPEERDPEHADP